MNGETTTSLVLPGAFQIDGPRAHLESDSSMSSSEENSQRKQALQSYQASVDYHKTAKAYSNLAASLSKLGKYDKALEAADQATTLEPEWAKGWWRRGVCAELCRLFAAAHQFYKKAQDIEPNEKSFAKTVRDIKKRMKAVGDEEIN